MSTQYGQGTTVFPSGEARGVPASSEEPAPPPPPPPRPSAPLPPAPPPSAPLSPAPPPLAPLPAAPPPAAGNAIRFGPRTRRLIRAIARVVNPLVLRIAGRRHMPILGIVHHRGRKTGRAYATPLGVRPAVGGGFVMPLTFSQASHWYQNIRAAGWCVITYQGIDYTVTGPRLVGRATAGPAYPRYERLALWLIGINEFVWLTGT